MTIPTKSPASKKKKIYPKHETEKAGKLLQHKHCNVCGKAVPVANEICSDECQKQWDDLVRKRKRTQYLFYAASIFLVLMILVSGITR